MADENDSKDGKDNNEGDNKPAGAFTQEQVDAMIKDAVGEVDGLKAKINELMDESKSAKDARRAAEAKAAKEAEDAARESGNSEALDASWQAKYAKLGEEKDAENGQLKKTVEALTVGNQAMAIASELALPASQKYLTDVIRKRLAYEVTDEGAKVLVRDEAGRPSALTLDELKAEFKADPGLQPLLVDTQSSGGGAPSKNGGAGNFTGTWAEAKTAKEKAEYLKQKRAS